VQEPHGLVVSPVDSVDARLAILVADGAADLQCPVDVAEDKYAVVPVLLAFAVYGESALDAGWAPAILSCPSGW